MSAHLVRVAWQRTAAALVINVVGMPVDIAIGRSVPGVPFWPSLGAMMISGALLAILMHFRRKMTIRLAASIFVLHNVGIVSALWITSGYYTQGLASWMPFQANKLGALIVAVLAPEQWSGLLSVGLFIGAALVKASTLRDSPSLAPLLAIEVWTLVIFGVVGAVMVVYRTRGDRLRDELVAAQTKSHALGALAQRLLAVCDLANTPLQILELNLPLLKKAEPRESVLRVERAIARLRKWHNILDREAVQLTWSSEAESFDAQTVLHKTADAPKSGGPSLVDDELIRSPEAEPGPERKD